jgi:transcriptional regulator with PAS, ATPase and Fis domain
LKRENRALKSELRQKYTYRTIFGKSAAMQEVFDTVRMVSKTHSNVLIIGESGTGKELVARAIHYDSDRAGGPFVTVDCAAIPSEIMESELFGHERGAFTGAHEKKSGLLEHADRGTVFLDEIGDLDLNLRKDPPLPPGAGDPGSGSPDQARRASSPPRTRISSAR